MSNHTHCPKCRVQLWEYFMDQGIARACPLCQQIYRIADYIARSPAFPGEVRHEAKKVSKLARDIGLIVLAATVLAVIVAQPKRRRR